MRMAHQRIVVFYSVLRFPEQLLKGRRGRDVIDGKRFTRQDRRGRQHHRRESAQPYPDQRWRRRWLMRRLQRRRVGISSIAAPRHRRQRRHRNASSIALLSAACDCWTRERCASRPSSHERPQRRRCPLECTPTLPLLPCARAAHRDLAAPEISVVASRWPSAECGPCDGGARATGATVIRTLMIFEFRKSIAPHRWGFSDATIAQCPARP